MLQRLFSQEHLYFSLTALDLLLVCFHLSRKAQINILIHMPLLSPLFTLRHMLCLTDCLQGY